MAGNSEVLVCSMFTDVFSSAIAIVPERNAIVRARLPRVRIEVACSTRKH